MIVATKKPAEISRYLFIRPNVIFSVPDRRRFIRGSTRPWHSQSSVIWIRTSSRSARITERMLRTVFGTGNGLTFVISGTGSGGMETAVTNFVEPGTKVAVLANGYFCDRMTEMAKRQGAKVVSSREALGRNLRRR